MKRSQLIALGAAAILAATSQAAQAHVGAGQASGFAHGYGHPIGGLDHILAMVMVGVLAFQIGGRAMWLVPLSFVTVMLLAGVVGGTGIALPFVELGIGLSVVALGAAVALGLRIAVVLAMGLVGFFATFHGFAHGAEMPATISGLAYGAGFVLATSILHALGIGLGLMLSRIASPKSNLFKATGSVTALAGVAMLTGAL